MSWIRGWGSARHFSSIFCNQSKERGNWIWVGALRIGKRGWWVVEHVVSKCLRLEILWENGASGWVQSLSIATFWFGKRVGSQVGNLGVWAIKNHEGFAGVAKVAVGSLVVIPCVLKKGMEWNFMSGCLWRTNGWKTWQIKNRFYKEWLGIKWTGIVKRKLAANGGHQTKLPNFGLVRLVGNQTKGIARQSSGSWRDQEGHSNSSWWRRACTCKV